MNLFSRLCRPALLGTVTLSPPLAPPLFPVFSRTLLCRSPPSPSARTLSPPRPFARSRTLPAHRVPLRDRFFPSTRPAFSETLLALAARWPSRRVPFAAPTPAFAAPPANSMRQAPERPLCVATVSDARVRFFGPRRLGAALERPGPHGSHPLISARSLVLSDDRPCRPDLTVLSPRPKRCRRSPPRTASVHLPFAFLLGRAPSRAPSASRSLHLLPLPCPHPGPPFFFFFFFPCSFSRPQPSA